MTGKGEPWHTKEEEEGLLGSAPAVPLGTEQVVSSIPGSVGYIYSMFIEPTITWVPSGFSGYIWLDKKNVLEKKNLTTPDPQLFHYALFHIPMGSNGCMRTLMKLSQKKS